MQEIGLIAPVWWDMTLAKLPRSKESLWFDIMVPIKLQDINHLTSFTSMISNIDICGSMFSFHVPQDVLHWVHMRRTYCDVLCNYYGLSMPYLLITTPRQVPTTTAQQCSTITGWLSDAVGISISMHIFLIELGRTVTARYNKPRISPMLIWQRSLGLLYF